MKHPTLFSLLTGCHHSRKFHGIVNAFGPPVVDKDRLTLPEMLNYPAVEEVVQEFRDDDAEDRKKAVEISHNFLVTREAEPKKAGRVVPNPPWAGRRWREGDGGGSGTSLPTILCDRLEKRR